MKSFFFDWPIIILLIGWLFGKCRISNAVIWLGVMIVIAQVLVLFSAAYGDSRFFIAALVFAMFGVVTSVTLSFLTSEPVPKAPIKHVVEGAKRGAAVYQSLPSEQKEKLHSGVIKFATATARIVGPRLAEHLRKKDRHTLAGIVEDVSKL
jgi:hypothetical protein